MVFSTYISGVPSRANVGDIITATIRPVCMNTSSVSVSYGHGSRGANDSRDEIRREASFSKVVACDIGFIYEFVITEEMAQMQRDGRQIGVWATESDDITTAYFAIASASAIMGRVRIASNYSCRTGSSGYIMAWYYDEYYDGVMTERGDDFGDGYARPSCRVFDEYAASFFRDYMGYCRQSIYDRVSQEEKDWLDVNTIVVPNDWTPMDGIPDPCLGVICDNECIDSNLYETYCDAGQCVVGDLIEVNSPSCPGYIPPDEDGTIFDMIVDNKELFALLVAAGAIALASSA